LSKMCWSALRTELDPLLPHSDSAIYRNRLISHPGFNVATGPAILKFQYLVDYTTGSASEIEDDGVRPVVRSDSSAVVRWVVDVQLEASAKGNGLNWRYHTIESSLRVLH